MAGCRNDTCGRMKGMAPLADGQDGWMNRMAPLALDESLRDLDGGCVRRILRAFGALAKPHRRHYYQLLANEKGIAHWKVSLGYGVFQVVVGGSVLAVRPYGLGAVVLVLAGWGIIFWVESWRVRRQNG